MNVNPENEAARRPLHRIGQLTHWWLHPRSTNRDEAFRERVIRSTLAIITTLVLLSFLAVIFVFRSPWDLISFPTVHVMGLAFCVASAVAVARGSLLASGWLLILLALAGSSGVLLLSRQQGSVPGLINAVPLFMFVPLLATLVLPRYLVIPVSLLSALTYGLSQFGFVLLSDPLAEFVPHEQISSAVLLLFFEGALLRQLRVEFDDRLEAMRDSMRQVEQAKQQAEADRQRAEQADRAKSQFLANMSHELRTPLNAIIGYDEAMLGGMVGEFTPQQHKLLGHIQHNSRRLLNLINDILDLSKIESGSLEVYLSPISPRKIFEQTIESLRSLAAGKHIGLTIEIADDVPEVILCDAKKLEQILVNLLSNALKFTSEGGVRVVVENRDQEAWLFRVTDTGIGIPEDSILTIFEPFRQVDGTVTRKYQGTGLGLAITKRLVEHLGGTIHVQSQLNKGSTFTVTLPRVNIPNEETMLPLERAEQART